MGFFYDRMWIEPTRPSIRRIRKHDLKPDDPIPADPTVRGLISEMMLSRRTRQRIADGKIAANDEMIETVAQTERQAFRHLAAYLSAIAWVKKRG